MSIPTRTLFAILLFAALAAVAPQANAWEDHSLPTAIALSHAQALAGAAPVQVESIETFLSAERNALSRVIEDEEIWAIATLKSYPPRPDALQFNPVAATGLRESFLKSLRINPTIRLGLFLQRLPGFPTPQLPTLPCSEVTVLHGCPGMMHEPFGALHEGDRVAPQDVLATASDEPDYGHDIGLWEDNGTAFGKEYGFGKQPFGNPAYEFSSQAPFHMGYFHESGIVYKAAPFLKRTFPEVRIHQFLSLAHFAFKKGHAYWGWRFLGWGMHYIQDLTQPYHSTVLPGLSVANMLFVNTIDLLGVHGPKTHKIDLVANRHFAIENFEFETLKFQCETDPSHSAPVVQALSDTSTDPAYAYDDHFARDVISAHSHALAGEVSRVLKSSLPKRLVNDPSYHFGVEQPVPNTREIIERGDARAKSRMNGLLTALMKEFGIQTRQYLKAGLR